MAHFAQINENNVVVDIIIVPDEEENRGEEYLSKDLGLSGKWIKTSYNGRIRNKYAGIGDTYDNEKDIFISPKPYPSWVLNSKGYWDAPIDKPNTIDKFIWDENNLKWNKIETI